MTTTICFSFDFGNLCPQAVSSAGAINSNWFPQHTFIDLLPCDVIIPISKEQIRRKPFKLHPHLEVKAELSEIYKIILWDKLPLPGIWPQPQECSSYHYETFFLIIFSHTAEAFRHSFSYSPPTPMKFNTHRYTIYLLCFLQNKGFFPFVPKNQFS